METRFRRDKTVELKLQRVEVDIIPRQCDVHGVCSLEMLFFLSDFFHGAKSKQANFKRTADLWIIFGCRGRMFLPHLLLLPIRSLDLQLGFAPSPLPGRVSRAVLSVAWLFQRTNRMDLRCETSKRWDVMP